MQMLDTLIRTKMHLPFTYPGLVSRPRLQEQIAQGLRGLLTLIAAPAGFGKTTLVASGVASCGMPVAWLSLDKDDNRTGRFLIYLVAALQEADNTVGCEAAQLTAGSEQAPHEAVLTSLINDLDTAGREIALVLDDYQFIDSQAIHDDVAFLLEHCPRTFHLVIASRSDPPLPLARLRARGQMVELRAADLRFSADEAAQFLNDIMDLHLDTRSLAVLEERTEGWIAGLQMAALSMRGREDVERFIQAFAGTNRFIMDFMLEEVLAREPEDVRDFLLQTAMLTRLTGPLCDAVTGSSSSQEMLERLERRSLFVVPLDDEQIWYRYHHLFADLLRARLDQIYPGLARQLHVRAADWLEHKGMTVEAINHTLAAREYDHAARLVEENTAHLLAQGEVNALMAWIDMLPVDVRQTRPWLCVHQASALMFAGQPGGVEPLLAQAEAAMETAALTDQADKINTQSIEAAEARTLKGAIAAVRSFTAVTMGQDAEGLSQAQQVRGLLTAGEPFFQSMSAWAIGRTMLNQGRLPEARLAFEEQFRLGQAAGHIWAILGGLTYQAQILQAEGHLQQARTLLEEALAEAGRQGARSRGFIAWVEDSLASVLYEQNELEAANRLLADAIMHTRLWPNPNHLVYAYALQARVLLAQDNLQESRIAIGQADQIRRNALLTRWIRRTAEAELVRVWLATQAAGASLDSGDPLAKESGAVMATWRSELAGLAESENALMDECVEIAVINLARVSLAAGLVEGALSWLEPLTRSACTAGHTNLAISSLTLTAMARQGKPLGLAPRNGRQSTPALTALEEALGLARPGGYVRVFLDEGQPMQRLLAQCLAHTGTGPLRDYTIRLLSHFDAEPNKKMAAQEKAPPAGDLVNPLTSRELDVLSLLTAGFSNRQIAEKLVLSEGTVKFYVHAILEKLGVHSRTQAILIARERNLV